jgi:hypothetical protein
MMEGTGCNRIGVWVILLGNVFIYPFLELLLLNNKSFTLDYYGGYLGYTPFRAAIEL